MKRLLALVWTGLVVLGWLSASRAITQNWVHTGPDLVFNTFEGQDLAVQSKGEVTLEAVSDRLFVFSNPSGETIVGSLTEPPLGWDQGDYYHVGPTKIHDGLWMLDGGETVTVHLKSETGITATEILFEKTQPYAILGIFALVAWGIFLWLGSKF